MAEPGSREAIERMRESTKRVKALNARIHGQPSPLEEVEADYYVFVCDNRFVPRAMQVGEFVDEYEACPACGKPLRAVPVAALDSFRASQQEEPLHALLVQSNREVIATALIVLEQIIGHVEVSREQIKTAHEGLLAVYRQGREESSGAAALARNVSALGAAFSSAPRQEPDA